MINPSLRLGILLLAGLAALPAHAFCGFYVAKADTSLFNKASKVVLVRDGNRTVLTMANDYQGDPERVRHRGAGADLPRKGPDPRRRPRADRPSRRLYRAAAGRIFRRRSLQPLRRACPRSAAAPAPAPMAAQERRRAPTAWE